MHIWLTCCLSVLLAGLLAGWWVGDSKPCLHAIRVLCGYVV
jgi:hypothetical protein